MSEGLILTPPRSALAGLDLPEVDGICRLAEAAPLARLVLRGEAGLVERLGAKLGLALAGRINTASSGDGVAALRLGPDEWLLLAEPERDPWLAARIGEAAGAEPHALVDVSHRQCGLVVEGPEVEAVIAGGCPLPLDLSAFPVSRATRTVLGKAEVVAWRQADQRFHLEVARSFAPYLSAVLAEAIRHEAALALPR